VALWLLVGGPAHVPHRFDGWTTDNGQSQNGGRALAQTPDGYLWFITFDGVVRFDGVHFTTYSTSNTRA
jgi:ligand-binding sensor domain-containing protein